MVIDLYLGFMDEEVNARLAEIVRREKEKGTKGRPVILIEREMKGKDVLLEWPASSYPAPFKVYKASNRGIEPALAESSTGSVPVEQMFARMLSLSLEQNLIQEAALRERGVPIVRLFDVMNLLAQRGPGATKTPISKDGEVGLYVVRFAVGAEDQTPIIVIRTPEMGLQPSLMRPYLRFLMKVVQAVAAQLGYALALRTHATNAYALPVRLSAFGAQGASDPKIIPGEISAVTGSLFVGAEYQKDGAYSLVAFCNADSVYEFHRQQVAERKSLDDLIPADAGEQAVEQARAAFHAIVQKGLTGKKVKGADSLPAESSLQELIQRSKGKRGEVVSLTGSYFVPLEDKEIAAKAGIATVGMEDYHILRLIRTMKERIDDPIYPELEAWQLDRINCDPGTIHPKVMKAFQTFLSTASFSPAQYKAILRWGLTGIRKDTIPAEAKWALTELDLFQGHAGQELLKNHLYEINDGAVADPFAIEIATDFVNSLASGSAFGKSHGLHPDVIEAVQKAAQNVRSSNGGETEVQTLLDLLATKAGFGLPNERLMIWLRPGKWPGVQTCKLDPKAPPKFEAAAVDRAFYKSANLMALQTLYAHHLFGIND